MVNAIITRLYLNLNSVCSLTTSIAVCFCVQLCLVYSVNFLLGVARLSLTEVDVHCSLDVLCFLFMRHLCYAYALLMLIWISCFSERYTVFLIIHFRFWGNIRERGKEMSEVSAAYGFFFFTINREARSQQGVFRVHLKISISDRRRLRSIHIIKQ